VRSVRLLCSCTVGIQARREISEFRSTLSEYSPNRLGGGMLPAMYNLVESVHNISTDLKRSNLAKFLFSKLSCFEIYYLFPIAQLNLNLSIFPR